MKKRPLKKSEKGAASMMLPDNLRREIITIELTEDVAGSTIIGEKVTEVLDLIPLHRQIDKYRRLGVNFPASTASD